MIINTAEELARLLEGPLDPTLRKILSCHAGRLSLYPDFSFEELVLIVIVEVGDRLPDVCQVKVQGQRFTIEPEITRRHQSWYEVTVVLSDDGFGEVIIVQQGEGADSALVAACEAELS